MKQYMVIVKGDDEQGAKFFDSWIDADSYRMDAECGLGYYAQVYEYGKQDPDDPYEPESYYMIQG